MIYFPVGHAQTLSEATVEQSLLVLVTHLQAQMWPQQVKGKEAGRDPFVVSESSPPGSLCWDLEVIRGHGSLNEFYVVNPQDVYPCMKLRKYTWP